MSREEFNPYPTRGGEINTVLSRAVVPIGGTGAPGTIAGAPGFTIARASAGFYNITFPPCVDISIFVQLMSPVPTVFDAVVTARNAAAGTATIKTYNAAGTITDPANGDELHILTVEKTSAG